MADFVVSNLLNPPILFFLLGALAVAVQSDLELPPPIPRLLSLYLLLAIGFKGGVALSQNANGQAVWALGVAMLLSALMPVYMFWLLRRTLDRPNAAALAATYASVSAVTFITASAFLDQIGQRHSGFMVAGLALMEWPAIITGVVLARWGRGSVEDASVLSAGQVLREALFNGSVLLLIGSLLIGLLTGPRSANMLKPFTEGIFYGALSLFLLDMGIVAGRRVHALKPLGFALVGFAVGLPVLNAGLGLVLARLLSLAPGDALLFVVLCASASYIAAPAAMRHAVPEANPAVYVTLALAVTFPLNVTVGIPLYMSMIQLFW
ncbi:MAG: sodium-dependent bicarbonate transport family permease [Anaerolineae bacterium]|nr:sodium-dependent bicarbonate transport family permease [Thermoflexales bacterium]MDW8406860.1 sodium-dependent bicarbonate transport family permease [Anaerolineae bacterium]